MSVQRYIVSQSLHSDPAFNGPWVRYADHVAALAEARTEGAIAGVTEMAEIRPARTLAEFREANKYANGYDAGRAEALREAREAVYRTCGHTKYEGCSPCAHDDAADAIDALGGQS
jgi:hypothetical protein